MRTALIASLIAAAVAAPSFAATRSFSVPAFDRVRSNVPFDVKVISGRRPGVVANGDQDVLDRLEIGVNGGGELVISTRKGGSGWLSGWHGGKAVIEVSATSVRGLTLNGPGDLGADRVQGRESALVLAGPGNIRVGGIETGYLDVRLSGPGDITAAGRAGRARIEGNGPGDIHFDRLVARDIDVTLNGPGNIDAYASGTARARLFGPGDIRIGGHPRCTVEKHGPGDVTCE